VTLGDLTEAPPHDGENRQPFLQKALGAAMDQIAGGGQGKIAFDRACPSVTQKRPLVSHFPNLQACGNPANGIGKTRAGAGVPPERRLEEDAR
jgi:hypothetical protein